MSQDIYERLALKGVTRDELIEIIDAEKIQHGQYDGIERSELLTLLVANVEHARHVESERLSVNSIFTAVVAGVMAFTLGTKNYFVGTASSGILLCVCILSMLLNKRWSDVFAGHLDVAKTIARGLYGQDTDLNQMYYFSHTPKTEGYNKLKKWFVTRRTATIFRTYYTVMCLSIFAVFIYYLYQSLAIII